MSSASFLTESAASVVNGFGVDTHIAYTDGEYSSPSLIISDLQYLGITQVRDGISNGAYGSAPLSSYIAIAKAGIQFTFIVEGSSNADLLSTLSLIDQVQAAVPGSVIAIEGPNEINNQPVTYNGVTGLDGALALQKDLYADVKSDPQLSGVSVDYFTGYNAGSISAGPDPATTPGLADYDNQHPYPNLNEAPAQWVSRAQALGNTTSSTEPAVYTETGYSSNNVDETVQAKYTLDLLLDTANDGIAKTYLYELMDAYAPGSAQGDDGYGLFDYTKMAKPVALGIHDLISVLQDTGTSAATFQAAPLNYTVAGLPTTGDSMAVEKSDGSYVIAVWAEPQIWNNTTSAEIAAPTETVTVDLPHTYSLIEVFDPLLGSTPIATYTNQSTVSLAVTDHPLLVELSSTYTDPNPGLVSSGAGADVFHADGSAQTFQYLSVQDSLASAPDTIEGFLTTVDTIDLSTLAPSRVTLTYAGSGSEELTVDTPTGQMEILVSGTLQASDIDTGSSTTPFSIVGDGLNGHLIGGAGDDSITAGAGNDVIIGGAGADALQAGSGADTFKYLASTDSNASNVDTIFGFATGVDTIDLTAVAPTHVSELYTGAGSEYLFISTPTGDMEIGVVGVIQAGDILTGSATTPFYIVGDNHGDTLIGAAGDDVLVGGAGNDIIIGGAGGDVLFGGAGADTFKYLASTDSTQSATDVIFDFQTGIDKIDLTAVAPSHISELYTGAGSEYLFINTPTGGMEIGVVGVIQAGDVLTGSATTPFYIVGDNHGDTLIGAAGDDVIVGGSGNNIIIGGAGGDVLYGGSGNDVFKYLAASDSSVATPDYLPDFHSGDTIDLTAIHTSAKDVYNLLVSGGATYLYVDQGGDGHNDMLIEINSTAVHTSDILW